MFFSFISYYELALYKIKRLIRKMFDTFIFGNTIR